MAGEEEEMESEEDVSVPRKVLKIVAQIGAFCRDQLRTAPSHNEYRCEGT